MSLTNKQTNYKEYLNNNNFSVKFSDDNKKIIFTCIENHENVLTLTSFANIKSKFSSKPSHLCTSCRKIYQQQKETLDLQQQSKHNIIFYHNKNKIDFQCINCKNIGVSTKPTLIISSFCIKCSSSQTRKKYPELQKEISDLGFILITLEKDYKDNKNILVKCKCNNLWKCSLNDIKRGRQCSNCKTSRTSSTNLLKYGTENVFQNDDIKKKSRC